MLKIRSENDVWKAIDGTDQRKREEKESRAWTVNLKRAHAL